MSIRIVTDSGADLDAREYQQLSVDLIPLSITVDHRTYPANAAFNKTDFFRMLEKAEIFPTTSQPAPADFQKVFEDARQNGDEVIYIALSSALSGTCQCASLVKELEEHDHVHIIDSLSATFGQKLLVLETVRLRELGYTASEIVAELEALKSRVRIYAGVDTLEYLYKGGRLNRAAAGLGTLAHIKPVISLSREGTVHLSGKGLGKAKAMNIVCDLVAKDLPDPAYPILGAYSGSPDNLILLRQKLSKLDLDIPEENCFILGPVIGAHIGPGAYGIIYIAQK